MGVMDDRISKGTSARPAALSGGTPAPRTAPGGSGARRRQRSSEQRTPSVPKAASPTTESTPAEPWRAASSAAAGDVTHRLVRDANVKPVIRDEKNQKFFAGTAPGPGRPLGSKDKYPRRNLRQLFVHYYESEDRQLDEEGNVLLESINEKVFAAIRRGLDDPKVAHKVAKVYIDALETFGPKGGSGGKGFQVVLFGRGFDPMHRRGTPLVLRTNMGPGREDLADDPAADETTSRIAGAGGVVKPQTDTAEQIPQQIDDEELELVEDSPLPCTKCLGSGRERTGFGDRLRRCSQCGGTGEGVMP